MQCSITSRKSEEMCCCFFLLGCVETNHNTCDRALTKKNKSFHQLNNGREKDETNHSESFVMCRCVCMFSRLLSWILLEATAKSQNKRQPEIENEKFGWNLFFAQFKWIVSCLKWANSKVEQIEQKKKKRIINSKIARIHTAMKQKVNKLRVDCLLWNRSWNDLQMSAQSVYPVRVT